KRQVLYHPDLKAVNTEDNPDNVAPTIETGAKIDDGIFSAVLKKHSWNVIVLGKK
ncbi:MAG TPA: alpha-N-arabinofuranosidase, partial [Ruminiclostridium sp.]|nr:alpha-N-arabinofuranosidase [Ruminiclostridium sp.]